ncbi:MAG: hypothetical protein ABIS38_06975, partial [Sphingomicrobium sp.]
MSMFVPVASPRSHRRPITRKSLLMSCASLALAAGVVAPQRARAQTAPSGYAGTINSSGGINAGTSTSSAIYVTDATATIDWTPTDNDGSGNIVFLPSSETVNYYGPGSNYTVLNRILPSNSSRAIELNGKVYSFIGDTGSATGGNIWFYSPGGILIGAGAVFDVGGLLLTTNAITTFGQGPDGFDATFIGASPTSKIQIASGAQLKALQQNSYIALVAPRIEQGGDVSVNGSIAYVAGEALSMTMNQGLFDIQFDWQNGGGTSDANGIVHTGSTTGTEAGGKMYLMAMPKNQAITMLIGGTIGYDATNATALNGTVVLSSGVLRIDDIDENPNNQFTDTGITILDSDSSIAIDNAQFLSPVQAYANRNIAITTVAGNVLFDGDLNMSSFYGGTLSMITDGGSITVGGNASLYTSPIDFFFNSGDSDDRYAGSIAVSATGGGAISTQNLNLIANGKGEDNGGGGDTLGGDGIGGNITIYADSGSTIDVAGDLTAEAKGFGGNMQAGATGPGNGYGGFISVFADDGTIDVTGTMSLDASGSGGSVDGSNAGATSGTGGRGEGGNVDVHVDGPDGAVDTGSAQLQADGYGGNAQTGGNGYGGAIDVYADDGSIDLGDDFRLFARGFGGAASYGFGGNGGYGQGGRASIEAFAYPLTELMFPPVGLISGGNGEMSTNGSGGTGGASNGDNIAAGTGGDGQGGYNCDCNSSGGASIRASVDGGVVDLGDVTIRSNGGGGTGGAGANNLAGGTGGTGYGGEATVRSVDQFETGATDGSMDFGKLEVTTQGFGGTGGASAGGTGGLGGDGTGGTTSMLVGLSATTGELNLRASGFGGDGGNGVDGGDGGDAFGGSSSLTINSGASLTAGDIGNFARGFGGNGGNGTTGFGGDGGDFTGGDSTLTIAQGGSLTADSYFGATNAPGGYELDQNGNVVIDPLTGLPVSFGGNGGEGDSGDGAGGNAQSGSIVATIDGTAT